MRHCMMVVALAVFLNVMYAVEAAVPIPKVLLEGKTDNVEYSVCQILGRQRPSPNIDIVVFIRNIGSKNIALAGDRFGAVKIVDKAGDEVSVSVKSPPGNMPFEEASLIHLWIRSNTSFKMPLSILYKNADGSAVVEGVLDGVILR